MRIVIPIYIESENIIINKDLFENIEINSHIYNMVILSGDMQNYFKGLSLENMVQNIQNLKNEMYLKVLNGFYNNILIDVNINNDKLHMYDKIYLSVNKYLFSELSINQSTHIIGYHSQRSVILINKIIKIQQCTSEFSFIQFDCFNEEEFIIFEISNESHIVFNNCRFINCKVVVLDNSIVEFNDCYFIGRETTIIQKSESCIKSLNNPTFINVRYKLEVEHLKNSTLPWFDCNEYDSMLEILEYSLIKYYYLDKDVNFHELDLELSQDIIFVNNMQDELQINIKNLILKANITFEDNIVLNTNISIENKRQIKLCLSKFTGQINLKNIEFIEIYNTEFIPIYINEYVISSINSVVSLNNIISDTRLDIFLLNINSQYLIQNTSKIYNTKLLMQIDNINSSDEDELLVDLIKKPSLAVIDSSIFVSILFDDITMEKFIAKNSSFQGGIVYEKYIELNNAIVDIENCNFENINGVVLSLDNYSSAIIKKSKFVNNEIAVKCDNNTQVVFVDNDFKQSSDSGVFIKSSIVETVNCSFIDNKFGVFISGFNENEIDANIKSKPSVYYDVKSEYLNNYEKSVFIGYGAIYEKIDLMQKDINE